MVLTQKSRTVKCENGSKKAFSAAKGTRGRLKDNTEDADRRLTPEKVAEARERLRCGFVNDNMEDANRRLTPEEIAEAREKIRKRFEKLERRYGFVME